MSLPSDIKISKDIRLLSLVEQNPVLYDTNHAKYMDANIRELAWTQISEEIEMPAKTCKMRWVNMRDMLRRRMRNRLKNPTNKYINKYKYEDEMSFILPFLKNLEFEVSLLDDESNSNDSFDKGNLEKTAASKLDYDQALKLIDLVKNHRILYDMSHPKNSDLSLKELAWEKIGEEMRKPAKLCKSKWVNIRDAMRRKLRCRQLKADSKNFKFKYKYEDELSFLIPYFNNLDESASFQNEDTYLEVPDESDHNIDYDSDANIEKSDIKFEFRSIELDGMSDDVPEAPSRKRKIATEDYDDVDSFLISIGSTLRKLKPLFKNQVKSKIFEVVQEYELKQITSAEGHSSDLF